MASQKQQYTILYGRLSQEDERAGESNSIQHQRDLLEKYARDKGFENTLFLADDGYSGTNFERPSWKKIVEMIEAGEVSTLIVKDASRLGREYLQVGYYMEIYFPQKNVRFIAVNDGVDSAVESSNDFNPIRNWANELHAKDTSRKVRAVKKLQAERGEWLGGRPPYGYRKSETTENHLEPDPEAAEVVRQIFTLCAAGKGPSQIARILTEEKVDNPGYYYTKHACGMRSDYTKEAHAHDWNSLTISRILTHQEYLGHTVNFRSGKRYYKDKRRANPPEKLLIFENTHEPIVTKETWELAQCALKSIKRTDTLGVANPLTGLVYCAECGQRLYNHRHGAKDAQGVFKSDSYNCSTYMLSRKRETRECVSHQVATKALRELILKTIQTVSRYALSNEMEFARKVREASALQQAQEVKEAKARIRKAQKRCKELDVLIQKLYESYALEKISEKRFDDFLAAYEKEQAELKAVLETDTEELRAYEVDSDHIASFLKLARKYREADELTTPMIYAFVERSELYGKNY